MDIHTARSCEGRFWQHLEPQPSGCWEWQRSCYPSGYGQVNAKLPSGDWTSRAVHRVAYRLVVGPIPDGLCVLHKCDNRPCANPDHLFLGDRKDNVEDMVEKGRQCDGEERVQSIRKMYEDNPGLREHQSEQMKRVWDERIAAKYEDVGLDPDTWKQCCHCREWKRKADSFHKDSSRRDGLQPRCRSCQNEARRRWREKTG